MLREEWDDILAKADGGDANAAYRAAEVLHRSSKESDREKTVQYAERAAQGGNLDAMLLLGELLLFRERDKSLLWLKRAYAAGSAQGGYLYALAQAERDPAQSEQILQKLAERGHLGAILAYAELLKAKGAAAEAAVWYAAAAKRGSGAGHYALGQAYACGTGVVRDEALARAEYRLAAERGYAPAFYALGECLEWGRGGAADLSEAKHWYEKGCKAGSGLSCYRLGRLSLDTDRVRAAELLRRAAELGVPEGARLLGRLEEGEGRADFAISAYGLAAELEGAAGRIAALSDREDDYAQAMAAEDPEALYTYGVSRENERALERALALGCERAHLPLAKLCLRSGRLQAGVEHVSALPEVPEAVCLLADCYRSGMGAKRSFRKSALLYQKAAQYGVRDAEYGLAHCLMTGEGLKQDRALALDWYRKAASHGQAQAALELSRLVEGTERKECLTVAAGSMPEAQYLLGALCMEEGAEAATITWWEKAAQNGNAAAEYALGERDWKKNAAAGLTHLRRAAEAGYAPAGRKLVQLYLKGEWETDLAEAEECMSLGANGGDQAYFEALAEAYATGQVVPKDEVKALQWYFLAAQAGSLSAQYHIGRCYRLGEMLQRDDRRAFFWFSKAERDPLSQLALGDCYASGAGCRQSDSVAAAYYKRAAESHVPAAEYRYAECCLSGRGVAPSAETAYRYFSRVAEGGYAEAMYRLAVLYASGTGCQQDDRAAYDWYRRGAEQGHALCAYAAAQCCLNGVGTKQDPALAFRYFTRSAEGGLVEGIYRKGLCLRDGIGVAANFDLAMQALQEAASRGHADAMYEYGNGLMRSDRQEDIAAGADWYRRAAEQGNPLAEFAFGCCLKTGKGVAADEKAAALRIEHAAEGGIVQAQWMTAEHYAKGFGVSRDAEKAADWYKTAANGGDGRAQYCYAACLADGVGVGQDLAGAVHWFATAFRSLYQMDAGRLLRAALLEQNGEASREIGNRFRTGKDLKQDLEQAFYWYQKAAHQGDAEGLYRLAHCYAVGEGVAESQAQALHCYESGAENGFLDAMYETALRYLDGLGTSPDPEKAEGWFCRYISEFCARSADRKELQKFETEKSFSYLFRDYAGKGTGESAYVLGVRYLKGLGVKQSIPRAEDWLKRAADKGVAAAEYRLGTICAAKSGEAARAVAWYRRAAEKGDVDAMLALALCAERGTGLEKNLEEALFWYQKGAQSGSKEAAKKLEKRQ